MKTLFLMLLSTVIVASSFCQQRKYVDIDNITTANPSYKYGWGIFGEPNFQDEFNGPTMSIDYATGTGGSGCDDEGFKVVKSDQQWRWKSDIYSRVMDPFYDRLNNIKLNQVETSTGSKFIRLETASHPGGINNDNTSIYPVTKFYSSSGLSTQFLKGCISTQIAKPQDDFIYGWFEIRCKIPSNKYVWPAFWLFGEGGGAAGYNEIDCFELGGNDYITHTHHWKDSEGQYLNDHPTFAMPGQSFSGQWVTYAVKWEPNKIIWYINNEPVRIVKDNDVFFYNGIVRSIIIPNSSMFVIAGTGMNMEWLRYNMLDDFMPTSQMDIDYIRVWQRFEDDPSTYEGTPDPVFSLNDTKCGGADAQIVKDFYFGSGKLILNASESYMPNHEYYISILQNGNPVVQETLLVDSPDEIDISHYNLFNLYNNYAHNVVYEIFVKGKSDNGYEVTQSQKFRLTDSYNSPFKFKLNQFLNPALPMSDPVAFSSYNKGKSALILDATDIYIKYGITHMNIEYGNVNDGFNLLPFTIPITNYAFDLELELKNRQSYFFDNGIDYYKLSLPGNPCAPILFSITPCTTSFSITLNNLNTGVLKAIPEDLSRSPNYYVEPGDDIILSVSNCVLCNNSYTVKVEDISEGRFTIETLPIQYVVDNPGDSYYGQYFSWYVPPSSNSSNQLYSIGNFDIRELCRQYSQILIPGNVYRVTFKSGSDDVSRTFEIQEPNDMSIYASDFLIYHYPFWCKGSGAASSNPYIFLNDMDLYMYSPDPQIDNSIPKSLSVDRSYTVIVEDLFSETPLKTFELTNNLPGVQKRTYNLKVLGSLDLRDISMSNESLLPESFLPTANKKIIPGHYRITLKNSTSLTFNNTGLNETLYGRTSEKTVLIVPGDRKSCDGEKTINFDKTIESSDIIVLGSNLRVLPGNVLTVHGELQFNRDCKIIVEPGATLVVDGGLLTNNKFDYGTIETCFHNNAPEEFWQGIEVWGNSSASQTPNSNQGVVEIINGGTIENATTGIRLCEADENGIVVPGKAGGIVFAENATFINNKVAIQFEPYMNFYPDMYHPRANISRIKDCTFKTTDQWIDNNQKPIAFIVLNGVDGINFLGNTFINEVPELFEARRRGMGIKSNNSSFNVNAYCVSNSIPCTLEKKNIFENLYYGIYALKITCTNPVNINNNEFKNNLRGVFLSGINNPVVTRNKFDVGKNESVTDVVTPEGSTRQTIILPGYGLYLQNISHFNVQENEFYSTQNGYCGSLVWKSGIYGKELYNNKYHDLQVGAQTSELNSGLKVKCNKFLQNLSIAGWGLSSGSVANPQGTCINITTPAGNTFLHSSHDIWVNNNISPFTYKYHNSPETTPVEYDPGNNLTLTTCPLLTYTANACPSKISGKPITQLITDISTLNTTLTDLNTNFDGGSTQALLDKVNSNIRTGQLKNVLMAASPYLSDTVIIATLERSNPLPSGHIKQILIGNSPLTNKVLNAVDKQSLPPGIKNEIQVAQTVGESARAILEQEISNVETDKTFAVTELMQLYAEDTSGTGPANIIAFLETQPDIKSKQMLVQSYFSTDRCSDAKTLLDQMPGISSDERDFYILYSLLAELCTSGNTVYELSSEQKQIVETLALSNSMVSANAQAIMSQVYGNWYWEKVEELLDFNSSTIKGMLYNSPDCDGSPVANDTLVIEDENGEILLSITPTITNENGEFIFSMRELMALDSNILYTLKTKSGFALTEQPYQTISEWINQSPLNLSLKNINLEWSDLYDSPDSIWSIGTNIDISGNIYVAGRTRRVNIDDDVVLLKYSPQGVRMWETIYASGINTYENANDMITDAFGNCYISLTSENTNVVLVKFNPDGQLLWSGNIENTIDKRYEAKKVKLTATGNVYIAGHVSTIPGGMSDIFIALYSSLGSRQWIKTYSFNDFDLLSDFSLDQNENIIITGYSYNQLEQIKRCLISKLSSDGALIWSATLNKAHSMGSKISADHNGSVIVAGLSGLSPQELFLSKYSSTGILEWENTIPSYSATDMFVDAEDRIYICGAGNTDIFVSRYNTSGIQDWIKSYNGSANGYDNATAMYPDQNNNVYLTGFTSTSPLPASDKLREMVTLKYDTDGELIWDVVFNTSGHDIISGNDIIVSENDNIYVTGQSGTNAHTFMTTVKYSQCPSQSALRYGVYSAVESTETVNVGENLNNNLISIYPNPYNDNTTIVLEAIYDSDVSLEVFTIQGQRITEIYRGHAGMGKHNFSFSAKKLGYSAGVYVLKISLNSELSTYRLIEMK